MSKSSNPTTLEDGDETLFFEDGFSIVDDINAATGAENLNSNEKQKTNGKESNKHSTAFEDTNSEEIVSDKEIMKKEANVQSNLKKDEADVVKETKETVATKNAKVKTSLDSNKCNSEKDMVKQEVTTIKKDSSSASENSSKKSTVAGESTLIITNDEELGPEASTSDELPVKVKSERVEAEKLSDASEIKKKNETVNSSDKTATRKRCTETSFVWVSNISKSVKASSLKKHFSECGKVNTAKVVTNGKVFFGYVEFESVEHAQACVKKMNNSVLCGTKILVSRTRPDVTKKPPLSAKKVPRHDPLTLKCDLSVKNKKEGNCSDTTEDSKKIPETKQNSGDNESKNSSEKKKTDENGRKVEGDEKMKTSEEKQTKDEKKSRSVKDDHDATKSDDHLRQKVSAFRKKIDVLQADADKSQTEIRNLHIEVRNLRRRLSTEQKKYKSEEMRSEKYRLEVRTLNDQLKQERNNFEKETHRLTKKHKLEMEKIEYQRDNFLKQREELKRRQEVLEKEFKKLEELKKSMEHMKRSRKSRSISPIPSKRYRSGRDNAYSDRSPPPPPPPKLSSEVRSKVQSDRPTAYFEEKKPRVIYDRLGNYGEKPFSKEGGGRHRSAYPGDVAGVPKSPWGETAPDTWKKPNTSSTFLKPYMERYATSTSHPSYQVPSSSSYYPSAAPDYAKHGHFDSGRKY